MIRRLALATALVLASMTALADAPPPAAIVGFWRTAKGGAVIHMVEEQGGFLARVVWLESDRYPADDPQGMGGQPLVDRHNPDPSKRDRPMIGLRLIKGLDYRVLASDRARWENGRVYDPDRGKWFDCYLWLADHRHLKLHGYVGIPALGRTTTWTRVPDPRVAAD
ncbi:DUF2147 domain-containing protein [Salinisphaera sp. RV14]|uniref:DUF2147 domain-containing protein n=1 Tax=unclassified Salinisphaera TaxID=2649847 RepID=UPI003F8375A6